jgi:peptide deformylase
MQYKLIVSDMARLSTPCRDVLDTDVEELTVLKNVLRNICEENEGLGLAANQIGSNLNVFYTNTAGPKWYVNPEILSAKGEILCTPEGCLSFPGEIVLTRRFEEIEIAHASGPNEILKGLHAVVFQHELDHLHGETMHRKKI